MLCISAAYAIVHWLAAVAGYLSVTFVYCVETAQDMAIVVIECKYETVPKLSNCTIFNGLE